MSTRTLADLPAGFADPVLNAQEVFRAVLDAMARPGRVVRLPRLAEPPQPLSPATAAIAFTLLDLDTPVWLDQAAASGLAADWLRFQCGCPITADPREAAFAVIADPGEIMPLDRFTLCSDAYPDRSATLLVQLHRLEAGTPLTLAGPGIPARATVAPAGLPACFPAAWTANAALYPRGVDLMLIDDAHVIGLPRTARPVSD